MSETPRQSAEIGRAIFETAKEAVDSAGFADAWRTYSTNGKIGELNTPESGR